MEGLINGILEYSRVGQKKVKIEKVYVQKLMPELSQMAKNITHKEVEFHYPKELPIIETHLVSLKQVLQNLISNAIRFTEGHAPDIYINAVTHERNWLFSVTDTGRGISPEQHSSLFNLFHRDSTEGVSRESGVGLAICEKIVRWHGGKIWLESEVGKGSTFYFTIPLSE